MMTREQANQLLEAVKNGADAPQKWINEALIATGDLCPGEVQPDTDDD